MTNELQRKKQFFEAIADQTLDAIGVADAEGNYQYVNHAFCSMVGYSRAELVKMTVFDVTSDSQDRATFARTKGVGEGTPVLVVLKRKDGTDFLAEVVGKNIQHGDHHSVLGVVRDVSERERLAQEKHALELELLYAQKFESLGVLAGGIAHDFNNLLAVILGHASLALDDLPAGTGASDSLHTIKEAAIQAAGLSEQMLAYSGKGQFVVEAVDARELISATVGLLQKKVARQIHFDFDFGERVPMFHGDRSQIRQLIVNVVSNAVEAIGDNTGTVSLSTRVETYSQLELAEVNPTLRASLTEPLADGVYTVMTVSDTGCGMDAQTIERLFDPFFTTKFTGRGLGMSAVLGILRGHKSAIKVDSVVGQGTTLTLMFPACDVIDAQECAESAIAEHRGWRGHGTALLVDDEPSVRKVCQRMLEWLGFDVLLASDGPEALDVYKKHASEIAFVLLDLTMPKMNGHQVFSELVQLNPSVKVVLSSGYSKQEATNDAMAGLAGFLQKPYLLTTLQDVLATILD